MNKKKVTAALALAVVAVQAVAETLTWVGGATETGNFSAAANWSPAQAPQPGDTLVVNDAVTFEKATFDVGTAGLTIENSANVTSWVVFTGRGTLSVHSKAGRFSQRVGCPAFEGDWRLYDGVFETVATLGSGTIYIDSGNSNAQLQLGEARPLATDIRVVGTGTRSAILFSRSAHLTGCLSSDGPFTIMSVYLDADPRAEIRNLQGGGQPVTIDGPADSSLDLTGRVAVPLVKKGTHTLRFTGTSDASDTTVDVQDGTVEFTETARWGGSSVTATGASTVLRFCGSNFTSPEAKVSVSDGATIDLVTLAVVPAVTLGGVSVANGLYRAADYPASLSGLGLLSVGGGVATWVGGAAGAWSDGANWSTGEAPRGTTVAWFTNAVELANETFDFGADGVRIWNGTGVNLTSRTMFAGSGKFYKFGAGQIEYAAESTYTGGTLLADGCARLATSYTNRVFGTAGTVELARSADGKGPYFDFGQFHIEFPYTIHFVGKTDVPRIKITTNIRLVGDVESDSDFTIQSTWGPLYADCGFRAVGKTITFAEGDEGRDFISYIAGAVDASLLKRGSAPLELRGVSTGTSNKLTVDAGTLRLTETAAWEGPTVVNEGGRLVLGGNANLSPAATLTVAAGGTVEVAKGVKVSVAALVVGGQSLPTGVYSAKTRPDAFAGEGRVRVGTPGALILIR